MGSPHLQNEYQMVAPNSPLHRKSSWLFSLSRKVKEKNVNGGCTNVDCWRRGDQHPYPQTRMRGVTLKRWHVSSAWFIYHIGWRAWWMCSLYDMGVHLVIILKRFWIRLIWNEYETFFTSPRIECEDIYTNRESHVQNTGITTPY